MDRRETKKEYQKGISINTTPNPPKSPTKSYVEKSIIQTTPKINDKIDKYITLIKEVLICKDDFLKLINFINKNNSNNNIQ